MARIVSVHEYVVRAGVDPVELERAYRAAAERGLFDLPGLVGRRLVRGVKGARAGRYAAIWEYASRAAWERLWGTAERPRPPAEYPAAWRVWEEEILAPLLAEHPDRIAYTTYEAVGGSEDVGGSGDVDDASGATPPAP